MKVEWLEKLRASQQKHQHSPSAMFAQLATVSPDNRPANRTVVFRSFEDKSLVFTTRQDSEKVAHLKHNPWAELCWYFFETREQYRISGRCEVIGGSSTEMQEVRKRVWHTLSDASRQMFTWPAPGKPLENPQSNSQVALQSLPETFVLLVLTPFKVETLDLRFMPHQRRHYDLLDDQWQHVDVNP